MASLDEINNQIKKNAEAIDRLRNLPTPWRLTNAIEAMREGGETPYEHVRVFGYNAGVTAFEDMTPTGAYFWPNASAATTFLSAGVNDTSGGTGARLCFVKGLLGDLTEESEEVVPNGTSGVTLANNYIRINEFTVLEDGTAGTSSAGSNDDTLVIQHGAGNYLGVVLYSGIGDGHGINGEGRYSVPSGRTAFLTGIEASHSAGVTGDYYIYSRQNLDATSAPFGPRRLEMFRRNVQGDGKFIPVVRGPFTEGTDIFVSMSPSGTSVVEVWMHFIVL